MEIKKRLFGGYKKSSVDAAISELNQKIEEVQANSRTLQHEIEIRDSKISDYIKRNEELKLENEALKSEKSENDLIYKNLAKIYQHAFDTGNQIVCEAKETASKLIEDINIRMDEMVRYSQNILFDYDHIHQETEALLFSLNNDISKVRQNVFTSINKAKTLTDMYSHMQDAAHSTSSKINKTLDEYKFQTSAFLTGNLFENDEKSIKSVPEIKTEPSSELYTAKHPEIFKVISNPTKKEATPPTEKESAPTVPENEVHPSLPINEKVPEEVPEEVPERVPAEITASTSDTTAEEIPVVKKVEQAENSESIDIPSQPEQPVASAVTESSKPDFGFTQYGRKSKLTAQERNEYIRKALLRNGG